MRASGNGTNCDGRTTCGSGLSHNMDERSLSTACGEDHIHSTHSYDTRFSTTQPHTDTAPFPTLYPPCQDAEEEEESPETDWQHPAEAEEDHEEGEEHHTQEATHGGGPVFVRRRGGQHPAHAREAARAPQIGGDGRSADRDLWSLRSFVGCNHAQNTEEPGRQRASQLGPDAGSAGSTENAGIRLCDQRVRDQMDHQSDVLAKHVGCIKTPICPTAAEGFKIPQVFGSTGGTSEGEHGTIDDDGAMGSGPAHWPGQKLVRTGVAGGGTSLGLGAYPTDGNVRTAQPLDSDPRHSWQDYWQDRPIHDLCTHQHSASRQTSGGPARFGGVGTPNDVRIDSSENDGYSQCARCNGAPLERQSLTSTSDPTWGCTTHRSACVCRTRGCSQNPEARLDDDAYYGDLHASWLVRHCMGPETRDADGSEQIGPHKRTATGNIFEQIARWARPAELDGPNPQLSWPAHAKAVKHIPLETFLAEIDDASMCAELRERYADVVSGAPGRGVHLQVAEMEPHHHAAFVTAGVVEEITAGVAAEAVGTLRFYCIPECPRSRWRGIQWTRTQNVIQRQRLRQKEKVSLEGVAGLLSKLALLPTTARGRTNDISWWFGHLLLAEEDRQNFVYTYNGRYFRLVTVPTGAAATPALAQRLICALTDSHNALVDRYIDNFFWADHDILRLHHEQLAFAELNRRLGISLNEDEVKDFSHVLEYHGLVINLQKQHVRLTNKTLTRLSNARARLRSGVAKWRDWLSIIGITVHACSVLFDARSLPAIDYYWMLKFARRKARESPRCDENIEVWPSVWPAWHNLLNRLLRNEPRRYGPNTNRPYAVLYTDASTSGWGAVLFTPEGVYIIGEPWPASFNVQNNINELELRALILAMDRFSHHLSGRSVHIYIDNTTALAVVARGRSKSFTLSMLVERLNDKLARWNVDIDGLDWIASEMNPADSPSRWFERQLRPL